MSFDLINLLNRPYQDGKQDCYGLAREYYKREYGLTLRNYARPIGFDHEGLDLLMDNFAKEGFQVVPTSGISTLEKADGLLFSILGSKTANHVGVYIGSGYFIHHLYEKMSKCEALDQRWYQRIALVVRHPDIIAINTSRIGKVNLLDLLPPHLRLKVQQNASSS